MVAAGEHAVERGDAGRDHQQRPGARRAHVEPGQRGERLGIDFGAIEQHHFPERACLALEQRGERAAFAQRQPGGRNIFAELAAEHRAVGEDRDCERHPGGVVGGCIGEIGLGHRGVSPDSMRTG